MKKLSLFLILSFSIFSCKKEPSVDFSYTGILEVGQTITFNNLSKNVNSYTWDFGNGAVSTAISPSYVYPKPGTYNVSLTAEGKGKSISISKSLVITGTTYAFINNTTVDLYQFVSFYWDGANIQDFTQHGVLESGKSTGIVITTRSQILFAFTFVQDGDIYFSAYPYLLTMGTHNDLIIDDNTQIVSGSSKSKSLPYYNEIEKLIKNNRSIK